jgi:hypothetical protein
MRVNGIPARVSFCTYTPGAFSMRHAVSALSLALFSAALATPAIAQQPAARPAPAPMQVPNPHYVTIVLTQDVNAPVDVTWAHIGKYCAIKDWAFDQCSLIQGDGGLGSERSVVNEVMVGATTHSYTYTQPVRSTGLYNLYHGTLEAQPVTAKTSRIVYSFLYDNSMLADDAAREKEMADRRARFTGYLKNMKVITEGGKLPAGTLTAVPVPTPKPEELLVPNPHYVRIPMSTDVNAPADKVWARIGKYCDIGEWGIPGCKLLSGDGGLGTIRSIGNEVLVGKTDHSYTYTQPVREGVKYNLYHGTLEVVPATATTSKINYTLVYDNSMLADDAARAKDIDNRRTRFTKMVDNMKILAEGGTLPPASPAAPPAR